MKNIGKAVSGPVFVIAFLIASFALVMAGVLQNLKLAEQSVKQSLGVFVYLQAGVSDDDAKKWADSLKSQDSEIQSMSFISKDQAYQDALKDPGLSKALMILKDNPLPGSVVLRYSDRAWWERAEPTQNLKASSLAQEIRWDPEAQSLFRTLHRWKLWCLRFSLYGGGALVIWAFMGIYRFLYLQLTMHELVIHLASGVAAGAVALLLGWLGLRSVQIEFISGYPLWMGIVPLLVAGGAAVGFFGVEMRHAE